MKRFVTITISLLITLIGAELVLGALNYQAGIFLTGWQIKNFMYVEDGEPLEQYELFMADSLGILKANQEFINSDRELPEFCKVFVENLRPCTFNKDGFRGNEFTLEAEKEKVFFIGDSYTFGFDAEPYDSGFVDLVEANSNQFVTFNGGVPAADLATYAKVAETYIPKIKPDIVVVGIRVDDAVPYNKVLKPFENSDIFFTNKGVLFKRNFNYSKDSIQVFNNAEAAYDNIKINYTAAYLKPKWLRSIVYKSKVATVLVSKIRHKLDKPTEDAILLKKEDRSAHYVTTIKKVAEANNCRLIFAVVPLTQGDFIAESELTPIRKFVGEEAELYFPNGITKSVHYRASQSGHFNSEGHAFFANFLIEVLKRNKKEE